MRIIKINIFLLLILASLSNCKEVDENEIEIRTKILTSQLWGYPEIKDGSQEGLELFLNTPTNFNEDGTVIIAFYYNDFWEFIDESSIKFLNSNVRWYFMSISDTLLHVKIQKFGSTTDELECFYHPV